MRSARAAPLAGGLRVFRGGLPVHILAYFAGKRRVLASTTSCGFLLPAISNRSIQVSFRLALY